MQSSAVTNVRLNDQSFWAAGDAVRREGFAALREHDPVHWVKDGHNPAESFWAVTSYNDVRRVSRGPEVFVSGQGIHLHDMPNELAEYMGGMIVMDGQRHARLRRIVNRAFTPRAVARLVSDIRAAAHDIVDEAVLTHGSAEFDFVEHIAAKLPIRVICTLLGVPASDHARMIELSDVLITVGDPETHAGGAQAMLSAARELHDYAEALATERIADDRDDLTTVLLRAEVNGDRLTIAEFGNFFQLLVAAGNETTRNALSHGVVALTAHPEQRVAWLADIPGVASTAAEEIVRYSSPVISFRRTAVADTTLGGQAIAAGEKVVVFYNSANRDSAQFNDPDEFRVRRTPNDHVGYGGGGPHFCLGAHLARVEIEAMFTALLTTAPGLAASGAPDVAPSSFVHSVRRLPCHL